MVPDRTPPSTPVEEPNYREPPELDRHDDDTEEPTPARLMADSFEAPAPGVLPTFEAKEENSPRLDTEPKNAIQIDIPAEDDEPMAAPQTETEGFGSSLPPLDTGFSTISEPPQTEDEGAANEKDDQGPSLLPDLPQAEELIPELPVATESARADS